MTDEKLCEWLEATGFPQAADAASRIREKNHEIQRLRSADLSVIVAPARSEPPEFPPGSIGSEAVKRGARKAR